MRDAHPGLAALSADERQKLEGWVASFDQSWHEGRLAECVRALPGSGDPLRKPALLEMVKIDLDRHWQRGRKPSIEDYLRDWPELGTPNTVTADLIQAEYFARQEAGDIANLAHFAQRFPNQAAALHRLVRQSLSAADVPLSATPSPTTGKQLDQAVELPEVFGRYRIARRLGQGGMGAVYLARDTELDREVALKVPHFAAENKEIIARFYREARAAAGLAHPNICPIYDVGQIDGTFYLTMGYVEGKPLTEFIRPRKRLGQPQVAALARKIALALEEAHRKGIVHRDLKPANIMINLRKEPIIMDFGLARRIAGEEARITQSGAIVGTPAYMSPEQISGKDAGPASDIYSLGVILYELLTAKLPFEGSVMAVLGQILSQEPKAPTKHRPDLQSDLEAVCLKAMAKKPADRFASMAEFAAALGKCVRDGNPAATASAVSRIPLAQTQGASRVGTRLATAASTAVMPSSPRRSWVWIVGAAGAVALLVWLGVTLYFNTGEATVSIELSDDTEAVEVKLNGEVIDFLGLDAPIQVKVGDQELIVRGPDHETVKKSFRLWRGGNEVVHVELKPNESKVAGSQPKTAEGQGLKCELYDGVNFERLVIDRVDPMVQWRREGIASPDSRLSQNHYSIRWTGWLKPAQPGRYKVSVFGVGGVARLWLGEKLLPSQWREKPEITSSEATVELDGSPQPLKLEFFKAAAKLAHISLRWAGPGDALEQPIPAEALFLDKAAALAAKPAPVSEKGFTMTVFAKTKLGKTAGISDRTNIGVLLNKDRTLMHMPLGPPRFFQPGGAFHFVDLHFDGYRLADVRDVTLVVNGTDAWGCESIKFQFFQGVRKSQVYPFAVNHAFSTDKRDKLPPSQKWTLDPPPVWEDLPGMAASPSGAAPPAKVNPKAPGLP